MAHATRTPIARTAAATACALTASRRPSNPLPMQFHLRPLPLRSGVFWRWTISGGVASGLLMAWSVGGLERWLWTPPRPPATAGEIAFSSALALLLAIVAGLVGVRMREGSCPRGARRATGIAGILGFVSLLCPVCLALPLSLFGGAVTLALLSPFAPLLQLFALLVLLWTAVLLLHENR